MYFISLNENLSGGVHRFFPTKGEEQKTFKFVPTYQQLTEEPGCVFKTVNALLKDVKNNGLSYIHIDRYIQHVNECLNSKCRRARKMGENLSRYPLEELCKLPDTETCRNASGDIIESIFSKYKLRRSKNPPERCNILCFNLTAANQNGSKGQTLPSQFQGIFGEGFYEGFNRLVQE